MDPEKAVGAPPTTPEGTDEPVRTPATPAIPAPAAGSELESATDVTGTATDVTDNAVSSTDFTGMRDSEEFGELRRAHRSFAFPLTIAFVTWYLLYVLLSNYAGGFMDTIVVGNINVAFVFGLAQFLTTFLIAWWYARHAAEKIDPRAEALKARMEAGE